MPNIKLNIASFGTKRWSLPEHREFVSDYAMIKEQFMFLLVLCYKWMPFFLLRIEESNGCHSERKMIWNYKLATEKELQHLYYFDVRLTDVNCCLQIASYVPAVCKSCLQQSTNYRYSLQIASVVCKMHL